MIVTTYTEDDAILMAKILIQNGIYFNAAETERENWLFEFEPPDKQKMINRILSSNFEQEPNI